MDKNNVFKGLFQAWNYSSLLDSLLCKLLFAQGFCRRNGGYAFFGSYREVLDRVITYKIKPNALPNPCCSRIITAIGFQFSALFP